MRKVKEELVLIVISGIIWLILYSLYYTLNIIISKIDKTDSHVVQISEQIACDLDINCWNTP